MNSSRHRCSLVSRRGRSTAYLNSGNFDQRRLDHRRLGFEPLEDRRLLAVFSVSNLNDSGPDSLRDAILTANGNGEADTINFSVAGQIDIASQLPTITDDLTIDGDNQITIDAGGGADDTVGNGDGYRVFALDDGTANLINVQLTGLTITGGDENTSGGAIFSRENLTIDSTNIVGNRSKFGGGIATGNGSATTISNSLIAGNVGGQNGGGVSNGGDFVATNVTISGNSAGGGGGIVSATSTSSANSTVQLRSSTISGNTATTGAGVWVFNGYGPSNLTFENTIIDNAVAGISGATTLVGDFNLFSEANPGITDTDNLFTTDPLLGPLANNGGPTLPNGAVIQTHALLPGSPALDAGNPMPILIPPFDQRGTPFVRLANGGTSLRIDIGAYEAQAAPSADFDTDFDVDGADFLAWQRGFGKPNAQLADGNSDDDTDTDASDLAA